MPMTITLDLPPDIATRVQTEAAKQSVAVEQYLLRLVERAVPEDEAARRERSLKLLRSVADIGDAAEQRETFEYLKTAVDEDRLSERARFK
jgi:hypothetical protein